MLYSNRASLGFKETEVVFTQELRKNLRDVDTIARLGGDEFVLLVEKVTDDHHVTYVADRVQICLTTPFQLDGVEVLTSPSIGIVIDVGIYDNPEDILRDADIALYRAKDRGKSRFEIFNPSMRENILKRLKLESDLRKAVQRHEFSLVYQPIFNISTGDLYGYEALTRWITQDGRSIHPNTFISIANETSMIIPLGDWILNQACTQFKEWQVREPGLEGIPISINFSSVQVYQPDFVENFLKVLTDQGLMGDQVRVEITEKTIIRDFETVLAVTAELKSYGVHIHLDDFGKEYSSLIYLSQLPVDAIKIDRYFMLEYDKPDVQGILKCIVSISHDLGKIVIAEGVETLAQHQYLKDIGCDYGQGFLYSAPFSPPTFGKKRMDLASLEHRYSKSLLKNP